MSLVPTIDISDPSQTELAALDTACRDHGFFLLKGHQLDDLIERTFAAGHGFFASSLTTKTSVRRTKERPLGWFDRELTSQLRDHKEVFDFIDPVVDAQRGLNQWPDGRDNFRSTMGEFFDAFAYLASLTLDLVWKALAVDQSATGDLQGSRWTSAVRLNHYTVDDPVLADERADLPPLGDVALGAHTDPGVITLLLQDATGGLQTESVKHGWIDVAPEPGTIVVNLGDAVQVWTNDHYRAARHRVLPMSASTRMSIPFFLNPKPGTVLSPIEALDGKPRYRPFSWQDFMAARNEDNFSDADRPDVSISEFLIS